MTGARSLRRNHRLAGASAAALLGVAFVCATTIVPAKADKVGVAAAVNPDAFSSLAGAPQSQINIGKSIFYNERINTTGSGLVQVLLVDGSTFTVGPGSNLVIDKFVYDPKKGTGQIAASFSKGVMRFVGGKLSKNDGGVTVDTPAGALAIRGGIAYADFKGPKNFSILFVFGEYLKLGGSTLYQPGYGWFMNNGQFNSRPFNSNDLKTILAALTNGNPNPTPSDTPKPNTLAKLFNTQSLNQLISDANTTQIVDQAQKAAANQQNPPNAGCEPNCPPPPPPRDGGDFNGYAVGLYQNGESRPGVVATLNPADMHLALKPDIDQDAVVAGVQFHRAGFNGLLPWSKTYDLTFTGTGADYVHDGDFWAVGRFDQSKINYTKSFINYNYLTLGRRQIPIPYVDVARFEGSPTTFTGSFSSRDSTNGPPPAGSQILPKELCVKCDFIKWGFWDATVSYEAFQTATTDTFDHGLWVAGQIAPVGEIDTLAALGATATYDGTAIGSVARLAETGWVEYTATGDLHMDWNFGQRYGTLEISKFDTAFVVEGGLSVSGTMIAPGQVSPDKMNQFGGILSGSGLVGAATGSFVKDGQNVAGGVVGNWGAAGSVNAKPYEVIGIFGGRQSSFQVPAP
jgi:hypothetical protein